MYGNQITAGTGARLSIRAIIFFALLILGALFPRPAAAQTGGISGFVVDTVGTRIGGATVRATAGPSTGKETVSRADGAYSLTGLNPGAYNFVARKDGFEDGARSVSVVSGVTSRIDFTLTPEDVPGGVLQGVVRRRGTDDPVPGARVEIARVADTLFQVTDNRGAYRFTDLDTGSYRVVVTRAGFQTFRRSGVTVREGRVTNLNIALRVRSADLGILEGQVTSSGRAIGGARVTLRGGASDGASDLTDGSGFYRIRRIVPDTYNVQVVARGFTTALIEDVEIDAGERQTLNVSLIPVGTADSVLEGFVLDEFGEIVVGARVETREGPAVGRFDTTDATGFYRIRELPAGRYTVRASASGFDSNSRLVELTAGRTTRQDFRLEEGGASGTGRVVGRVTAAADGLSGVRVRVTAGPSTGQSTTTDADGDYVIEDLPAGTYTFEFSKSGFTTRTIGGVLVSERETTELNVEMRAAPGDGSLTGTVRDEGGLALSGVRVEVRTADSVVATGNTNNAGEYTISGIEPGRYSVRFSKFGYRTLTVSGVVIVSGQTTTLNARLGRSGGDTGTVRGLVRDTAGRAIEGATIELDSPDFSATVQTDVDGRFIIENVPAGRNYTITASSPGMESDTRTGITVEPDATVNLTFTLSTSPGGGGIAGTVRNSSGFPITGATVTIIRGPAVGSRKITDRNGRFNFTGLPSGTYVLEVRAFGFQPARAEIQVRAGGTAFKIFYLRRA